MIDQKTNKRFECDYVHTPIDIKKDYHPESTLAQVIQIRQQAADQVDNVAAPNAPSHAPSAPPPPSRSHSRRGGSREINRPGKPPSPLRKMFNLIFGM
jgi:hypothetical protein